MASSIAKTPPTVWQRLFTPERRRFIKFGIVGGSGVFVNLLVVGLVGQMALADMANRDAAARIAFFVGIVVSVFTNFLINDRWTWGDREKKAGFGGWLVRCRDFYIAASLAGVLQWAISTGVQQAYALPSPMLGISAEALTMIAASLVGIIIAMPINYVLNHIWTFRERDAS